MEHSATQGPHVVELGQLGLIWTEAIGASYKEGSAYSRAALTLWVLHPPLGQKLPHSVLCSAHMNNSQHHASPLSGFHSQRSRVGHGPLWQPGPFLSVMAGSGWQIQPISQI